MTNFENTQEYWRYVVRYFNKECILESHVSIGYLSYEKCVRDMVAFVPYKDKVKNSFVFPMLIHRQARYNWFFIHWDDGTRNISNDFKTYPLALHSLYEWIRNVDLTVRDVEIWQAM